MIDYDDESVKWWMHEIEYIVRDLQFSWEEITVDRVMRELDDLYELSGTELSDEVHEICEDYLQRFNDPFDGLGDVHGDLLPLTKSARNAMLKAVTAKSDLLKSHAAELDAFVEAEFGESTNEIEPQR